MACACSHEDTDHEDGSGPCGVRGCNCGSYDESGFEEDEELDDGHEES